MDIIEIKIKIKFFKEIKEKSLYFDIICKMLTFIFILKHSYITTHQIKNKENVV